MPVPIVPNTITIVLEWENRLGFKLRYKKNDGDGITILHVLEKKEVDQNDIWPSITKACQDFFEHELSLVINDMLE